ncbi:MULTISPECIES: MFS transporter [unclassified Streptomyces]|uniref:MFS transporter n=1 Tax=unclassified Streptomyces TaxID=2593676 RepID=UPI000DC77B8D|nr:MULTISPECIES: MFS transporter [unclassified Streptomyces]AWZ05910.1 MFS transporter [Streptomyces sp. ICC4]AWZ11958.1 MFS transporter [Streptomyces sp. ICC1]
MSFRELHPNIKLRLGVGFVQRLLGIMLMPLMVIHLAALYGAATAGALTLAVAVAGIACNFLGGHLADVHGRKPLMVAGEIGATLTFGLLALANSPWWQSGAATFVLFLLNTCLASAATPAADAMMIDVSTPENRTLVYTINYWSINMAFTLGALIGGFFYGDHFALLLTAAAALSAATTLVTWWWIAESAPQYAKAQAAGVSAMLRGYLAVSRDRVFLRLMVAATFTRAVEVQIGYYIAVRLSDEFPEQALTGLERWFPAVDGVAMLGILRAVNTALVVVFALFAGSMFRRLSDRVRLYAGLVVFTAGYMVLAVSNSGWILIAAAVLMTLGEIANVPVKQALLADLVDPAARTKYLAAYGLNARVGLLVGSLCVSVGAFVSPVGMSLLYGAFGLGAILVYRSLLPLREARRSAAEQSEAGPADTERNDTGRNDTEAAEAARPAAAPAQNGATS